MADDSGKSGPKNREREKGGHAQDGSMVQTVVDEQLFIETAKDDQFSEMPGDPRSQAQSPRARQAPAPLKGKGGAAPASDIESPENARETSGPEKAPEDPVEGLVLGNSGFPSRGN